jgi:hypothetical protein
MVNRLIRASQCILSCVEQAAHCAVLSAAELGLSAGCNDRAFEIAARAAEAPLPSPLSPLPSPLQLL